MKTAGALAVQGKDQEESRTMVAATEAETPTKRPFKIALLRSEALWVVLFSLFLAILMTWPTVRDARQAVPNHLTDPLAQSWIQTWSAHALTNSEIPLWDGNVFYPAKDSFAFTDMELGYFPLSFLGDSPETTLLRYNLLYIFTFALAFAGAYALARQLGSRWPGAVFAGLVFAYNPWTISHSNHLNILSTGGIALTLAALARGHGFSFRHGYQPSQVRPLWAGIGWAVACWQVSIGFALGLSFIYFLALVGATAFIGWLIARRPAMPLKLIITNIVGGISFGLISFWLAQPALRITERYNAETNRDEISYFSPKLPAFLHASPDSILWGWLHEEFGPVSGQNNQEVFLFPGLTIAILALAGIAVSIYKFHWRITVTIAILIGCMLALGTNLFGGTYTWMVLYKFLPGWSALRTPARLIIYPILLAAILAAGFITWWAERLSRATDKRLTLQHKLRLATVLLVVPALLAAAEGLRNNPMFAPPSKPVHFTDAPDPILVLPSTYHFDAIVMFWTVGNYKRVVNGSSRFLPPSLGEAQSVARSFPDQASVDHLRQSGIRSVVVAKSHIAGTDYADTLKRDTTGLPIQRKEYGDIVIFTLTS